MPIRPAAAREVARRIVTALQPDVSNPVLIDLAASLITNAVDEDELRVRVQDAELKLIGLDGPDSLGG